MKDVYDILFEYIGDLFKLLIIFTIILVVLQYIAIYMVGYKTVAKAEEEGFLSEATYLGYLNSVSFDTSNVTVELASPPWDEPVYKLGDPFTLIIKKEYKTTIFDREITIPMVVKREGINHGYYGEGYGNYNKND